MKVLVTGGAGYIGSHTVAQLLERGDHAWVLDDLSTGHPEAVPAECLLRGSLADRPLIEQILREKRIEAVVHFAASALVGESVRVPERYYRNNFTGTLSLLEAMLAVGVARIVFSSTCATYGVPDRVPISEDCPQQPINPYGRSKLAVEWLLDDFTHVHGFGFAALRYFNACGAAPSGRIGEDHDPESHLIPLVLQTVLGQRPHVTIFGSDYPTADGTCIRDYIHVDDLADAHIRALQRLESGRGLKLNLGTGTGYSVREVIDTCAAVTGKPVTTVLGARRPGDPAELVADASAARRDLEWQPRYRELGSIVETAWNWHRTHPHGYRS